MRQYSLTSIWYWSLNSVAFIVATFGTVQAIVPSFQPSLPVKTPPQPVKEPFDLSFNLYKPNTLNNINKPKFRLSLLKIPNAESQKCQVFSCLPPNPFHKYDAQPDLPELNLQQDNYRYTSSNIKSYKIDKLAANINSPLNRTEIFIPVTPIQQANTPITSQQAKPKTDTSGIFPHTYELHSTSKPVSFPSASTQTQAVIPEVKKVSVTVGDAVYLVLASGAEKNTIVVKTPKTEPSYTWNETDDTSTSKRDFKLSLMKDTDSKIARLNELIDRQNSRNALNSKITDVILVYRKFLQAQEKVRIAEDTLNIAKTKPQVNLTNHRVALLVAKNQLEARRLELTSILGLDKKTQIVASDIPVIKPIPLDFQKLQQIALNNQPNYLRDQLKLEISKLKQTKELETVSQLDMQLQNSIRDINSIYSQLDGAKATKLAQQVDTEDNINDLTTARNNELDLTIQYLNALTNLDLLLGTTLDTWQISIQ
ncbi:hypothetical protein NIES4071_73010 [Calothrix sp. NIES-4071]|nr:hypothetical protein NIES4071_73010 [Calothrix sp. NIES-4071]BAZ61576.1 hypothetical protein NIES4105_72960 [Calothrix sp. NIES-4105]